MKSPLDGLTETPSQGNNHLRRAAKLSSEAIIPTVDYRSFLLRSEMNPVFHCLAEPGRAASTLKPTPLTLLLSRIYSLLKTEKSFGEGSPEVSTQWGAHDFIRSRGTVTDLGIFYMLQITIFVRDAGVD